jgi:hypothetical protein
MAAAKNQFEKIILYITLYSKVNKENHMAR